MLRVWGDLLQKKQWDPLHTRLALPATATAAPGSITSLLRDDAARDLTEAIQQLVALAPSAPSQALEAPVQLFDALTALPSPGLPMVLGAAPSAGSARPSAASVARRLGGVSLRSKVGVLGCWATNLIALVAAGP